MKTLVATLAVSLASLSIGSTALAGVRVLESDHRHVLFEIVPPEPVVSALSTASGDYVRLTVPDFGSTDEVGRPEIPVASVRVAIPPGHAPRLRVVDQVWSRSRPGAICPVPERTGVRDELGLGRVVEREPVEGAAYRESATYPPESFRQSAVQGLRGHRVVSVIFHAASAEVLAGSHRVLERAILEVIFDEVETSPRTDPTEDPGPGLGSGAVLNSDQARSWRLAAPADGATVGDAPWGGGDQWKVEVPQTGMVEVTFAALSDVGFPSGVPIEEISVYQRTFDLDAVDDPGTGAPDLFVPLPVPSVVRDRNSDDTFNGLDGIQFYGRSLRDQWMTSGLEHEDRFDERNFVWIRRDPVGGIRMDLIRPDGSLSGNPADSLASTPSSVFRERDLRYHDHPPDHHPGRDALESEIYYWNDARTPADGEQGWIAEDPFTALDPVPGRPATLVARVAPGSRPGHHGYTNEIEFRVNGELVGERTFYNNDLYAGGYVPPENTLNTYSVVSGVQAGENTFQIQGWTYIGNGTSVQFPLTRFFMDWYRVTYARELRAQDDQLTLSTGDGSAGNVLAHVRGFGGADLRLFDVTDPAAPSAVGIAPDQVVDAGDGLYDLRFDHENAQGTATYVVIRDSRVPVVPLEQITHVPPSALLAGGAGARYVVVAHDALLSGAEELADFRSSRYTTLVAPVSQVYDVFYNGMIHPLAIKGLAAYAYHRGSDPIAFLCLVGDASEDHRGISANSSPDLVPSHSLWGQFEGAPEESDQYYGEVTRPGPGEPFDDLVDIHVGRLSVNTPEELGWNLDRIREYEGGDILSEWKQRVLFLADDQFSGSLGGGFGVPYGWQPSEGAFEDISNSIADSLRSHPTVRVLPENLDMSAWSHPCPDSCYSSYCDDCENELGEDCGTWYECRIPAEPCILGSGDWAAEYVCMREAMWTSVLPILADRLNEGVALWNFQGHGNRFLLTHEEVFKDFSSRRDVESHLHNDGRPFLFIGFACHLAEFDKSDEGSALTGDCLSEKMMNLAPSGDLSRGAIGAFASSGFEFLVPDLIFNRHIFNSFYPRETGWAQARVLGEATTRARLLFQQSYPNPGNLRQSAQRFVLLGDPALRLRKLLRVTVNGDPLGEGGVVVVQDAAAPLTIVVETGPDLRVVDMRMPDPIPWRPLPGRPREGLVSTSNRAQIRAVEARAVFGSRSRGLEVDLMDGGGRVHTEAIRFRVVN